MKNHCIMKKNLLQTEINSMSKTCVIGDIHGCKETLLLLLEKCNLEEQDTVISLGDILHKGPSGGDCVRIIKDLPCNSIFVVGNHTDKHIRWYDKTPEQRLQMTWTEDFELEHLTSSEIEWLRNGYLYYSFEINDQKYLCIHAGIGPEHTTQQMQVLEQMLWRDMLKLTSGRRKSLEKLLRLRYIDPEGNSVKNIQDIRPADKYWADIYGGEHGIILFGHQPFLRSWGPRVFDYAIGLDTGCVHGNCLTALVLEEGAPATSISVQNPIAYCPAIHTPHRNPI